VRFIDATFLPLLKEYSYHHNCNADEKLFSVPPNPGVSTTDIVGRMLLMNKDHHCNSTDEAAKDRDGNSLLCEQSKFLTTSRMLRLFSAGMKSPQKGQKIMYIDGAFDMFHCGHVSFLEEAKKVRIYNSIVPRVVFFSTIYILTVNIYSEGIILLSEFITINL